ncbi:hypothetical protein HZS_7859 [Henneguya salminicola]|nr:hypothetical protein HZS_7859 [Henneguya salminicola]
MGFKYKMRISETEFQLAIILHACSLILMLPPLKNIESYFSLEKSTILYLIEKEVIRQPTQYPNCPNSRIKRRKRRWRDESLSLSYFCLVGIKSIHNSAQSLDFVPKNRKYQRQLKLFSLGKLYERDTVNHSVNFIDARTGAPTYTIEGTWDVVKGKISPCNRTNSYDEDGIQAFYTV